MDSKLEDSKGTHTCKGVCGYVLAVDPHLGRSPMLRYCTLLGFWRPRFGDGVRKELEREMFKPAVTRVLDAKTEVSAKLIAPLLCIVQSDVAWCGTVDCGVAQWGGKRELTRGPSVFRESMIRVMVGGQRVDDDREEVP